MIGGTDIVLEVNPGAPAAEAVFAIVRRYWPSCVFQDAEDESTPFAPPDIWPPQLSSREFFLYRDQQAALSWEEHGAAPENRNLMLHVILPEERRDAPAALTLVCDEVRGEMKRMIREIQTSLAARRQVNAAFGLDLSGYGRSKSSFARADRLSEESILVTIFNDHPFAETLEGRDVLDGGGRKELEALQSCEAVGPLYVDVPIDLQGLPMVEKCSFVWELTRRPVDAAFFPALPPLADRIGYPVARFQRLLRLLAAEGGDPLGDWLFETYPAASLKNLELPAKGYKGQRAHFRDGEWSGGTIARIATGLKLQAAEGESLTDDDLDALICAVTGVASQRCRLEDDALRQVIAAKLMKRTAKRLHSMLRTSPPRGYVVLQAPFSGSISIQVERRSFALQTRVLLEAAV